MNSKFTLLFSLLLLAGCGTQPGSSPTGAVAKKTAALTCPTSPSPDLMTFAVCACGDLTGVGTGLTTHRSAQGQTANIGINGKADVVGDWNVEGTLRAHDGIGGVGTLSVRDNALTFGDFEGVGQAKVGGDLAVRGNMSNVGELNVGGVLKVGGTTHSVGGAVLSPQAFDLGDGNPCNCAGLDVAAEVAKGAAQAQTQALDPVEAVGDHTITLTTGTYSLASLHSSGAFHLKVDGAVALYVTGDVSLVGEGAFDVPAGSTLDLYVAGNFESVGNTAFTAPPTPGAVRAYVNGRVSTVGEQSLALSLYAPNADLEFVGTTTIQGSVLAHSIATTGGLEVTYASPAAPAPGTCTNDPLPMGSTDGSDGVIGIY